MRRMLRIVVNVAMVFSALLCVAALTLWARSYWIKDEVSWRTAPLIYSINTQRGGIFYVVDDSFWLHHDDAPIYQAYPVLPLEPPNPNERLGFLHYHIDGVHYFTGALDFHGPQTDVTRVPLYPVVVVSALLPLLGCVRLRRAWRRRSRLRSGLCIACGYDCRATPDRCPECGRNAAR